MPPLLLSIVIPVYNSQASLALLVERLRRFLSDIPCEIILVNDGSRDDSEAVGSKLAQDLPEVKFISLRRNFGEFNAVMCGLNHCRGRYAVMIDDDFQNPPEEIMKLVDAAEAGGYDVVYTYYGKKEHAAYRNLGSRFVNWVTTYLLDKPRELYLSSFKLIRNEVVQEIIKYTDPYPYIDGLLFRVTRNVGTVEVLHAKRAKGRSNYTPKKLASLLLNILFCYSTLPIRLFLPLGLGVSLLGLLFLLLIGVRWLMNYDPVGWQVVSALILLMGGLQVLLMGMIGEYVGKGFMARSGRPQYVIKHKTGW